MENYLGIEFGSTRIKAVVIDEKYNPVESGDYTWKSDFINGVWTYELGKAIEGLKTALSGIENRQNIAAMGVSGMMHGYLAFDKNWNLLVPFRTWQNTITAEAAEKLSTLFNFNIPQRWSIAHLYQAMLQGEEHVGKIAHITTLSGYIHFILTGENVLGIGDASGMFPIDPVTKTYDAGMIDKFQKLVDERALGWNILDILPKPLSAGEKAGELTEQGATIIDGLLPKGIPFAPPEGDGDTGMTATNSVAVGRGNVSAGTSIFSMVVLDKPLKNNYEEIDVITTPTGVPVAMVHCNNCTNDSNAWVSVLRETAELFGANTSTGELYTKLYEKSLDGDADCGGVLVCNYMAGEGVTHFDSGRPLVLRSANSKFTLANFMRSQLYSTMATLALGMELLEKENVVIKSLNAHGGLFKTKGVGAKYMAAACNTDVTVMKTAGEGGPYGMALLAAYCDKNGGKTLEEFLASDVFGKVESETYNPDSADIAGFRKYLDDYKKLIEVEKTAVEKCQEKAMKYNFWFVVGSQFLYGEEVLKTVEQRAKEMAEELSLYLPYPLVYKVTAKTNAEITEIVKQANFDDCCAGIITWCHTFSPSKMWINGLANLGKPYCHLATQYNKEIPNDEIDMDFMNLNQAAHGDREHGFIAARLRTPRKVIAGYWKNESVHTRIADWMKAAVGVAVSKNMKVMRFGDNMREVAVTEGDKVEVQTKLGWQVNTWAVGDLVKEMNSVTESEIDALMEEYTSKYEIATDDINAIRYQAREEIAMKKMLDREGCMAFTNTFQDLYGMEQLPGLASQSLMSKGYGYGGEGDWKVSAMTAIMKAMGENGNGASAFMEDYTYHLEEGEEYSLGAHMLEVCPSLASEDKKPRIETHHLGIGMNEKDPARLVFEGKAGEAIVVSLVDMGGRLRLICQDIVCVKPIMEMPNLPVARVMWRAMPNLTTGVECWIIAGGAHHTVLSYDVTAEQMRDFARMMDIEFVHITKDTKVDALEKELFLNDLAWKLK